MKPAIRLILALVSASTLLATAAQAFEIYAIGTSATNCKGVDQDKTFTVRLQEILRRDGYDATVINGGIDGDRPVWIYKRLPQAINARTRLVIFEPGPNDPDPAYSREYAEKGLAWLQEHHMPAIYMSSPRAHSAEQAADAARRYGAYYYGTMSKGVPVDRAHWQFDNDKQFGGSGKGPGGHMTAEGCLMAAQGIAPLVEQVLQEKYPGRKN